ncbi:hypothetical protein [Streptomyces sp. NBC_00690]|uniref:hypothetical protein n=1 Tax=Streptomyces sp. NBC_00690 TaxID=2975808 RepID=UPI002E2CD768|nr:hypothetical protein [Streptomyces sp. NBC_00690]
MLPRKTRTTAPTAAEADAWAEVLVRRRLLHTALPVPTGQWLVQATPASPVRVLDGPAVVELAARIQLHARTSKARIR